MREPAPVTAPSRRRRRLSAAALAVVLLAALLLAACGDGDDSAASTTTEPPATSSTTAATTTTTGATPPSTAGAEPGCDRPGSTADQESPDRNAPPVWLLTDVRTSRCDGKDRIVFEFRTVAGDPAATPPYDVDYEDPPFRDSGEGREVTVDGRAFLEVELFPAAIADLDREGAPLTYAGPRSITPSGATFVRQLALFDAFEGYVKWAVGLDAERPFRVQAVAGPPRIVIDVG